MKPTWRLLAVLNAALVLGAAFGCGDEGGGSGGGCGPAPEKKEEQAAGGGLSGGKGGGSVSADLTTDRRGKVPKAYSRPTIETAKSTATIKKPIIAVSTATTVVPRATQVRVIRRKVDGVADRVELTCRIIAVSPDGKCSGAKNYAEIKELCCPGGLVERCRTSMNGVVLVGRGCEPAAP